MASRSEKIPPLCDGGCPGQSRAVQIVAGPRSVVAAIFTRGGRRTIGNRVAAERHREPTRRPNHYTLPCEVGVLFRIHSQPQRIAGEWTDVPSRTAATSAGGKREGGGDHGRGRRGSVRSGGERAGFTARGPSCEPARFGASEAPRRQRPARRRRTPKCPHGAPRPPQPPELTGKPRLFHLPSSFHDGVQLPRTDENGGLDNFAAESRARRPSNASIDRFTVFVGRAGGPEIEVCE